MSSEIRHIRFSGRLNISGVYNFNRVVCLDGNDNHKAAKQDNNNIDFTSSRCLRHEMYKDSVPNQPLTAYFAEHFNEFAATEVGLIRGYLHTDSQIKRRSCLSILDAYTIHEGEGNQTKSALFVDQGSSSKPKESKKEKNKKGKEKGDPSIFSQDNAPPRQQRLEGGIDLKCLQFLPMDNVYGRMVLETDEEQFIIGLRETFKKLGLNQNDNLIIGEFREIASVYDIPKRGILLTPEQQKALIKSSLRRISQISGIKAGASIQFLEKSLTGVFSSIKATVSSVGGLADFESKLEQLSLFNYYEKV